MPTLHLPIAVPGSGKSTLAEFLVSSNVISRDCIVSPDAIREWMTGNRSDQTMNGPVFDVVNRVIDARMSREMDIFLDATNLTGRDRNSLLSKAEYYNYEVVVYLWDGVDESEIRHRNRGRVYSVPEEVMDRMFNRLKSLDLDSLSDYQIVRMD